jgi:hypothetical protein
MTMNTRNLFSLLILVLFAALAAGCKTSQPTAVPTIPPVHLPTNPPVQRTVAATPTPAASPTPLLPSPTPLEPAVKVVQDYFAALEKGDNDGAAQLYSNFSLMVDQVTRGDASGALRKQMTNGTKWSALEVLGVKTFNDRTVLVHVRYQLTTKDAKTGQPVETKPDEDWAVRQESGQQRINRGGLIDFETLEIPQQTTAGLTVKPLQLSRYTDHLTLTLLVQNQTNDPIVLGQANEVLATFQFGDQQVQANPVRYIFDHLRSYPNTTLTINGLYAVYPDGVIIRQWKNVKTDPWYTFSFH